MQSRGTAVQAAGIEALDLATAATTAGISAIIMAGLVVVVGGAFLDEDRQTALLVAAGLILYGIAFLLVAYSYRLPLWIGAVVGNGLLVASFTPFGVALRQLSRLPVRMTWAIGAACVVVCMVENLVLLHQDGAVNQRLVIGSLCQIVVALPILAMPRASRDERGSGLWIVFAGILVFTVGVVQRTLMFSFGDSLATVFDRPEFQSFSYISAMVTPLVVAVGFVQIYVQRRRRHDGRIAERDALTGTWNRRGLYLNAPRLLTAATAARQDLALLVVDLDDLKVLNDSLGHRAGDEALTRIAFHLAELAKDDDIVCRLGGDEFVVVLTNAGVTEAAAYVEALRARLDSGHPPLSASIGVAVQRDADDLDSLIDRADHAMYDEKRAKRRY